MVLKMGRCNSPVSKRVSGFLFFPHMEGKQGGGETARVNSENFVPIVRY